MIVHITMAVSIIKITVVIVMAVIIMVVITMMVVISIMVVIFSRMRSRRVPVLKLGSRGPGGDAVVALCSQSVRKASAKRPQSVRKRSQAFAEGRTCRKDERDENRREM